MNTNINSAGSNSNNFSQSFKMINLNNSTTQNPSSATNANVNTNISAGSFKIINPPAVKSSVKKTLTIDLTNSEAATKLEQFKYLECKTKETKYVQAKFSSLNKCLLVSREDGYLELINFNNGKLITEMKFHTDVIMDFDIDTKNGIILTASIDGYANVINFDTFNVVSKFHPLNPTRNLNASKIINLLNPNYDPESNKKPNVEMFTEKNINSYVFNLFNPNADKKCGINLDIDSLFNSPNTSSISAAKNPSSSGNNISNNVANSTKKAPAKITNTKDKEISFSIISGGQDSKLVTTTNQKEGGFDVLIYNSRTGELIVNFQDHFGPINTLACNDNAKLLASGAEDATIRIYKLENYLFN